MKRHVRTVILLAATAGLLALFFRQTDLAQVWQEIKGARPLGLSLALGGTVITYLLRSLRWHYLLSPLGPSRFRTAFRTTVIGFAANSLLPARVGEVLRPYLLARSEGLNAPAVFATIIIERLLDLIAVLLFLGAFLMSFSSAGISDDGTLAKAKLVGVVAATASLVVLAVGAFAAGHSERLARYVTLLDKLLPARIAHAVAGLFQRFLQGFAVLHDSRVFAISFLLSIPLWLAIAAGIWFVTDAFHMTIPFTGSFLVTAVLVLGVAAPTPGAVGGFHYAYRWALTTFFHMPSDRAVGAAIVLHAISFVPVAVLGAVYMFQDGLDFGRVRRLAQGQLAEPRGDHS